ncbi:MAG: NifB/NifX family molybdenum-iron cluster-binding protein [Limnochordia bacterium]|nr:NifB/NifX family molybdenum-iron cluster-binding protein [Limnochordia bacterium]
MKVAVSTDCGNVATHFGRCPHYTIADIVDGHVTNQEVIPNPGHQPGFLPKYLAENGIECIIAGGMGPRAEGLFKERGILTITGITGSVEDTLAELAAGTLKSKDSLCEHE